MWRLWPEYMEWRSLCTLLDLGQTMAVGWVHGKSLPVQPCAWQKAHGGGALPGTFDSDVVGSHVDLTN
jgi:hypothetical protein